MIAVALFCFKRVELLEQVLNGIKKNNFEKLYIFQDKYIDEKDKKDWEKVSNIIKNVSFAEKEVYIAEEHKGLASSIIEGMSYVFEHNETAMILEDDMVLLDGFEEYLDEALRKYGNNPLITGICGASAGVYVPRDYKYDVFFSYRMFSQAFVTWKKNWNEFCDGYVNNPFVLQEIYKDPLKLKWLKNAGDDLETFVIDSIKGKINTWATYWSLYQVDKKAYTVTPCFALADDRGHKGDGTGTNSKKQSDRYDPEFSKKTTGFVFPTRIIIDERIVEDHIAVMNHVSDAERFRFYSDIYSDWIKMLQNGQKPYEFFVKKNTNEVYIFGTGKAAFLLTKELDGFVEILGYVVENTKNKVYMGKTVIEVRQNNVNSNIPIVITPSHDRAYLLHIFRKYSIKNELIWLEDIFCDL